MARCIEISKVCQTKMNCDYVYLGLQDDPGAHFPMVSAIGVGLDCDVVECEFDRCREPREESLRKREVMMGDRDGGVL